MRVWAAGVFVIMTAAGSPAAFGATPPSSSLTPGAVDPHVTQDTIVKRICTHRGTVSVRRVSTRTRNKVYAEYQVQRSDRSRYVIDHLVPLEFGGASATTTSTTTSTTTTTTAPVTVAPEAGDDQSPAVTTQPAHSPYVPPTTAPLPTYGPEGPTTPPQPVNNPVYPTTPTYRPSDAG